MPLEQPGKRARLGVLRMQSWHRALLSKAASAQLCQGQAGWASHAECQGQGFTACSSVCCQGQLLPLPQGCWDQVLSPSNLEFQRLLFSCLRKEQWGKVSVQPRAARCLPVSITSTHRAGRG